MAEMNEKVVFEIDVTDYLSKLEETKSSINELIRNQKQLREEAQNGNKDAAKALEAVNVNLKLQQQEYAALQRTVVGFVGAKKNEANVTDFSNNSVRTNRLLLKQLTEQYNDASKAAREQLAPTIKKLSDELKKQEAAIGDTRRNVGNYKEAFVGAFDAITSGVPVLGQFKMAQQGINAVMSANPIGGIITLLTSLFQIMQTNAEVADQVSFAFSAVNKGFQFIVDTIVKTVTSFDKLSMALLNPVGFIKDLAVGTATAAKEAFNSAKALDQLKETIGEVGLEIEKNNGIIDKQNTILRDTTKSAAERKKAGELIIATEQKNADLRVDLANKELEAKRMELKGLTLSSEQKLELYNKEQAVIKAANEQENATRKARLTINKLFAEEEKAANEKRIAELKENQKLEIEGAKQLRENVLAERELLSYGLQTQAQLDAEFEKAQQEDNLLTYKEFVERKKKIYEGYIKSIQDIDKENEAIQKEQDRLDKESDDMRIKSAQAVADAEQKILDQSKDVVTNLITDVLNTASKLAGDIGNILQGFTNLSIDEVKRQYEEGEISSREFQAKTAELKLKAWKESKAVAITQAVMNTANAVMAQLSNPTPYVGIVLAALAAATGAAQIALISKQRPPSFAKFAEGGAIDIDGKPHSQGGTPIHVNGRQVAEAEKGEKLFILKKTASQQINALSAFNQMFGGRSLTGSPVRFAAEGGAIDLSPATRSGDGGFFSRSVKTNNEMAQLSRAVMEGVRNMPAPVVSVKEINRVQSSKDRSVKVSELG